MVARQWASPSATRPPGRNPDVKSARERIADRLIGDPRLLPLGASAAAVRRLLGAPELRTARSWRYLAARYQPAQGWGSICERFFTVRFERGRVSEMVLPPPHCPPGVNP
jgi:hypothetical protein